MWLNNPRSTGPVTRLTEQVLLSVYIYRNTLFEKLHEQLIRYRYVARLYSSDTVPLCCAIIQ
jgi:hypothetical protein